MVAATEEQEWRQTVTTEGKCHAWLRYGLFAVLLIAATWMRIDDVGTVTLFSRDEVNYARLTEIVRTQGAAGLQIEAARFRAQPALFEGPSPMRAGYLYAMATMMRISGWNGVRGIALSSALLDGASLCLVGLLAWTRLGPWRALTAMLLYAVSPPVLAMARRAWEEPLVVCLGLVVMLAGLRCVEKRGIGWAVAMGALAGFSITIKEMAFAECCLLLFLAVITLVRRREWMTACWLSGSFLVVLSASWLWLGKVLGGVAQVLYFLTENLKVAAETHYAMTYQSGTVMDWLRMLWKSDPFLMLLGGLGIATVAMAWSRGQKPSLLPAWSIAIVVIFVTLPVLSENRLNLRFAAPLFTAMCWLGAEALFAVDSLLQKCLTLRGGRTARAAMVIYLSVITIAGVRQYETVFATRAMMDLSAGLMLAPDP